MKHLKFRFKKWHFRLMKFNMKSLFPKSKKQFKNLKEWIMKKQFIFYKSFSSTKVYKEKKENSMIKATEFS